MNYKVRRKIMVTIQKAKESRNLFMLLNNSGVYRDRIKLIRERAQLFQKLQVELTNVLKSTVGKEKRISPERYKTSFYNVELLNTSISQKRFYNLMKYGDHNCLSALKLISKEKNIPTSINKIMTQMIPEMSNPQNIGNARFIPEIT